MLGRLGGRKLTITFIVLSAGVAIDLATERGLSENLMYLMMAIMGAYVTGNVVNKRVTSVGTGIARGDEEAATKFVDDLTGVIEDVNSRFDTISNRVDSKAAEHEEYLGGLMTSVNNLQQQMQAVNKRVAAALKLNGAE